MTTNTPPTKWTFIRICGLLGFLCSMWNLFGDLYFMDFYTAQLSEEEFAMVRTDLQKGYLFDFSSNRNWWIVLIAQSGSWMYPIWTFVTVVPIYLGLQHSQQSQVDDDHTTTSSLVPFWRGSNPILPCIFLSYGLLIIGGNLHNAFTFLTVTPSIYHHPETENGWSNLINTGDEFTTFLQMVQTRTIQMFGWGALPGIIACNIGQVWMAVIVYRHPTYFSKWYNLFNPLVTTIVAQVVSAILPTTLGFYFAGCTGTWGMLVLNMATTHYLWNYQLAKEIISSTTTLGSSSSSSTSPLLLLSSIQHSSKNNHHHHPSGQQEPKNHHRLDYNSMQ